MKKLTQKTNNNFVKFVVLGLGDNSARASSTLKYPHVRNHHIKHVLAITNTLKMFVSFFRRIFFVLKSENNGTSRQKNPITVHSSDQYRLV